MTILVWDLYQILKWRKNSPGEPQPGIRWYTSRRLAMLCVLPWLAGLSIAVVPSGWAGVRVNQFLGTRPGTLYSGVHLIFPLIEKVELYARRATALCSLRRPSKRSKRKAAGSAGAKRAKACRLDLRCRCAYQLDPGQLRLTSKSNLPQPVEEEMIAHASP